MTTGTKIALAVFACVVGVLVVYYGMIVPRGADEDAGLLSDPAQAQGDTAPVEPPTELDATEDAARGLAARDPFAHLPAHSEGILSETLRDATGREPDEFDLAAAAPDSGSLAPDEGAAAGAPERGEQGNHGPVPLVNIGSSTNAGGMGTDELVAKENGPPPAPSFSSPAEIDRRVAANQPIALLGPHTTNPAPANPLLPPPTHDYFVKEGDTMVSIADDWFSDQSKWPLIAKANPLVDPTRMQIGQKLKLPPRTAALEPEPPAATPEPSGARPSRPETPSAADGVGAKTYTVKAGDTLSSIARRFYKNPALWERIHEANRTVIGRDPGALKIGMKLTLPEVTDSRSGT